MSWTSRRLERKVFAISDRMNQLREEERLVAEELAVHRHLADDAERDALVSEHATDKADARETAALVRRFEREVEALRSERLSLEEKRGRLLDKLEHL